MVFLHFFVAKLTTNQTLYTIDSVFGVGYTLALSNLTDKTLTRLINSNNTWCRTVSLGVSYNFWFTDR